MIIDCHAHIASPAFLPDEFFDGWLRTVRAALPPLPPAQEARLAELFQRMNDDAGCEQLGLQMADAGIDRAVLLVIDFGLAYASAFSIRDAHDRVAGLLRRDRRFIGFAGIDPRRPDGLPVFERAVTEQGFSGLKLYPPCGFSPSDPRLFPYYEICEARHLPVLTHVGPSSSTLSFQHTRPWDIDEAARRFPKVNFILAHGAVVFAEEASLMAQFRPNVYLDISGFQTELTGTRWHDRLREHLSRGLSRKLLFGTDWPIYRLFGNQARWVAALRACAADGVISQRDLDGMLGGNLLELLPAEARRD